MKAFKFLFSTIIFFIITQNANGQTGLWLKAGLSKSFNKKIGLSGNIQSRYSETDLKIDSYIGELGLKYALTKKIDLELFYRYIHRIEKDPFHRFYANLGYKFKKLGPLKIDYRLRYQQQFKDDATDGFEQHKNYWRNKLELALANKTKLEPFISADLFYQTGNDFDQIRYKIGLNWDITKKQSFEVAAQTDKAIKSTDANQNRVVLSYKIKL